MSGRWLVLLIWMNFVVGAPFAVRAEDTSAAERSTTSSLTQAVADTCTEMGEAVIEAAAPPPEWLCAALPLEGEAATRCRERLVDSLVSSVEKAFQDARADGFANVVLQWERRGSTLDALQIVSRLEGDLELAVRSASDGLEARAKRTLADLDLTLEAVEAEKKLDAAWRDVVAGTTSSFTRRCRGDLVPAFFRARAIQSLREGAEVALTRDQTKEDGFSPVVRCQWLRAPGEADRLDCTPGLALSGQESATIRILPPEKAPDFRLAWVQATTGEEGKKSPLEHELLPGTSRPKVLSCPGYEGEDPRKLSCDEICFAKPSSGSHDSPCADGDFRAVVRREANVTVHLSRIFGPSYGCHTSYRKCAFRRLRGESGNGGLRERPSLLLAGESHIILIHALDADGRLAHGSVRLGYERWRVETGGFLAISPLVDQELVQAVPDAKGKVLIGGDLRSVGAGQVAVLTPRDADERSQETGIFVNFIPRNYETFGLGFGLATHDGEAPSIYFGPVLRLRSFGHRGLAAFMGGVVMRQVDRFPDFEPGVYDADSSFLQPSSRFEDDWFVGIQLGFSFGSISVPGSKE